MGVKGKGLNILPTIKKLVVSEVDYEIMGNVQHLACNPSLAASPVTINQIVGDSPVAAWDILPLTTPALKN